MPAPEVKARAGHDAGGAPDDSSLRRSALLFAALGDPVRLRLVVALSTGQRVSIVQLTAGTGITRQAITKHLRVLAGAGLVHDLKIGRERCWEFEPAHLEQARRSLDLITQQWQGSLARLKKALDG